MDFLYTLNMGWTVGELGRVARLEVVKNYGRALTGGQMWMTLMSVTNSAILYLKAEKMIAS